MDRGERERRFVQLYESHFNEVYRYVFIRTGFHQALAEDISQEIFLDVFRGFDQFLGLSSEKTWVMRIARNKVTDFYRKKARACFETVGLDDQTAVEIPDDSQNLQTLLESDMDKIKVMRCLEFLPEHYRMALLLKYADGRSVREIAEIAGKTGKSIDNILLRAKQAFIRRYALLGVEDEI